MKNKFFKLYLRINICVIIISVVSFILLSNTFAAFKGNVQGTGFIYEQKPVAGSQFYDADSKGNLYFAGDDVVLVFSRDGDYLYTLPIKMHGGMLSVLIDDKDNITVYDARGSDVNVYNQNGFLIDVQHGNDNDLAIKYLYIYDHSEREKSDGTIYKKVEDSVTKAVNGVTTVVFKIPLWQKVNYYVTAVMILSIVALFAGIFGAYWKRNFYDPRKQAKLLK